MQAQLPGEAPPSADVLLWAIEHDLRCIAWALAGGAGSRPEPLTCAAAEDPSETMRAVAEALGIGGVDG